MDMRKMIFVGVSLLGSGAAAAHAQECTSSRGGRGEMLRHTCREDKPHFAALRHDARTVQGLRRSGLTHPSITVDQHGPRGYGQRHCRIHASHKCERLCEPSSAKPPP